MDAHEQTVFESELAAAVMGKGEDFRLFWLDGPLDDATTKDALDRGYEYAGVLAVINGQCHAKCAERPGAVQTIVAAAVDFAQQVAEKLQPKGDEVKFLERLYRLPDTREN